MNRRLHTRTAIAFVVFPAAVTAWLWPRGPWHEIAALLSVVASAGAGYAVGRLVGSRWAYAAPLVFGAALELGRLDVVGPTVDLPANPGDTTAWIAFLAPRLVHMLLTAVPMLIGVRLARSGFPRERSWGRWTLTVVVALLGLGVAVPPTTAAIPGGIAEIRTVEVNGRVERMLIRGTDSGNPVLLWLSGGPGGTELGVTPEAFGALEQDFVVVSWDQPGAGLSASALPRHGVTLDDAVADTIAVTEYLRAEFGHDKIYLAANSGGTMVGVLAVGERPEMYAAYFGSGQMVDVTETDQIMYRTALEWADANDPADAQRLRDWGPPPYPVDEVLTYLPVLSTPAHDYGPAESVGGYFPMNLLRRELGPIGVVASVLGMTDTFALEYPSWDGVDLREVAPTLDVPVYLLQGAHEHPGRQILAQEWFDILDAPAKQWITCPDAGHRCMAEDVPLWTETLRRVMTEIEG